MNNGSDKPYRQGVGMVIMRPDQHIWLGYRSGSWRQPWQFPQGGIDEGETVEQALFREMHEEVGLSQDLAIKDQYPDWLLYDFPKKIVNYGPYRGQTQKWFLVEWSGAESDIVINDEFEKWCWVPFQELDQNLDQYIVSFKRDIYRLVLGHFKPFIQP